MKTKQAKNQVSPAQQELAQKQISLHSQFSSLKPNQRALIAQYFNSYNLTAWLYNDLLDQDSKLYVDQAINFTRESYELDKAMNHVESSSDVEQVVNDLNNGN